MKFLVFFVLIPAIIFIIGNSMTKNNNSNLKYFEKISKIVKLPPKIIKNYIGNLIKFSPLIYYVYIIYNVFNPLFYFTIALVTICAMIWHIRDVTGKPVDIIINNFDLSISQIRKNFFMKLTILLCFSCVFTSIIMTKIIEPIAIAINIMEENEEEENKN